MYCSKCGRQVPDDAHFCRYCGYDFSSEESDSACSEKCESEPIATTDSEIAPTTETPENTPIEAVDEAVENETQDESKLSRRRRIKRQREIEDQRSLQNYTVSDDMVRDADVLPSDRLVMTRKGTLKALKVKEIVYIILAGLFMIGSAVAIYFIKTTTKPNEESMSGLVILGYFLFFVIFFALCVGVDRVYNMLTLSELESRRITLKKYGFRMDPLTLKDGIVYALSISGECDQCNGENKGTYNIEWQGDELIAVCSYDRKHLYRIAIDDIVSEDDTSAVHTEENEE